MRRSLIFFWRSHLAVAAAAAVATAVLSGALVVGDSVKGSLADLARERLGRIDDVLAGDRLVREELAVEVEKELGPEAVVAAALLLPGSAVHGGSEAGGSGERASKVTVLGVDERFARLYPEKPSLDFERRAGQVFPSVILNQALARELSVAVGDEVMLSFETLGDIPKETLVGRAEGMESLASSRWSVAAIVPDRGLGGFALAAEQARSFNAFVERGRLARILDQRGKANALLLARGGASAERARAALARRLTLEDFGLILRPGAGGATVLESRRFVLEAEAASKARELARAASASAMPVLTYLANRIATNGRTVPYSTVTAYDGPGLVLEDGSATPPLAPGEIYLNTWAAKNLDAKVGDEVVLGYYVLGAKDEVTEAQARFRLRGVVKLEGLGADPALTPEFPGMSDSENMADWDPPFPVDLTRLRPIDEAYWDRYKSAPKAFVGLADGQRLWRSRFGDMTSMRIEKPIETIARELPRLLNPDAMGLKLEGVRQRALAAAEGATDFAGLFLGFSWFLIVSSALLVALLFRLGVEQRAKEAGLLAALGYPLKKVRRRFLAEGGVVALVGVALGTLAGLGYAALMLWGLRTLWQGAVGTPLLFVHAKPATLAVGALAALTLVGLSIRGSLSSLLRVPAPALLAGSTGIEAGRGKSPARLVAWAALLLGLGLVVAAVAGEESTRPGLAFGTGAALLVAGLAAFTAWCRRAGAGRRSHLARGGLAALAARSTARNAGRSVVSVALVASASFLLVAVGAQRGHRAPDALDRASGTGGFALVAESDAPLYVDLSSPERRAELGFTAEQQAVVAGSTVLPFRILPGEDASCLNLFRPGKPRVLGAPPEFLARGGFTFSKTSTKTGRAVENPWTLLDEELGEGVIAAVADANSAQWILKLGIGDELELTDDDGQPVKLRLVGMLAKSLFQSELLISSAQFDRHFSRQSGYRSFLLETPAEAAKVGAAFEAALSRFGFDATSTVERLAAFQAVESTYLATFQLLGGLGLLLGTLGLGVVLLRNVLERRAELAALSAFGFGRARLRLLVVAENAFLLLVGLGLGSGAALVAVAPHLLGEAAGIPWASLAATLILVFAVGLSASLAAVRVALATPLLAALRGR